MTVFSESRHPCEGIVSEGNGFLSRDTITIGNSQTIVPGSVLGKVTVGSAYVAWDPAATDGSQDACAVALYPATTGSSTTAPIAALVRDCEFRTEALMWKSGTSGANILVGIGQLKAHEIVAR